MVKKYTKKNGEVVIKDYDQKAYNKTYYEKTYRVNIYRS
jgi:hypothetical protein